MRTDRLGDLVLSLKAISMFRKSFPETEVHVIVGKENAGVFWSKELADKVIEYNGLWKTLKEVRKEKYDMAVNLSPLKELKSSVLLLFSNAEKKTAVNVGLNRIFADNKAGIREDMFEEERAEEIAVAAGCSKTEVNINISASEKAKINIENFFKEKGIGKKDFIVVIQPGAKEENKRWRIENYMKLAEILSKEEKAKVFVVGSKQEEYLEKYFEGMENVYSLIGRTSIEELFGFVEKADLVVCNSTATSHIAYVLKKPVIVLMGPSSTSRWSNEKYEVVQKKEIHCVPCERRDCLNPNKYECMKAIEWEEVAEKAKNILGGKNG